MLAYAFLIKSIKTIPSNITIGDEPLFYITILNDKNKTYTDLDVKARSEGLEINYSKTIELLKPSEEFTLYLKGKAKKEGYNEIIINLNDEELHLPIFVFPLDKISIDVSPNIIKYGWNTIKIKINSNLNLRNGYLYIEGCPLNVSSPLVLNKNEYTIKLYADKDCYLNITLRAKSIIDINKTFHKILKLSEEKPYLLVYYEPKTINKKGKISLKLLSYNKITNIKIYAVSNISVSPNPYYLPFLDGSAIIDFDVFSNSYGKYPIKFVIEYEKDNKKYKTEYSSYVIINEKPKIVVSTNLDKNLEITIGNPNPYKLKGVYVTIADKSYFIGEIDPNDYDTAYFNLKPGKYNYTIYYQDWLGNQYKKEGQIIIPKQEKKEKNNNWIYLLLVLPLLYLIKRLIR
ncbi:NEQ214 [Nanoarchaeum equitans Kin4-M]|uniref:NEQ214 n=1 Tax=Nanoarchaeum equitans (strain Kin4-M) TaxID=228908 RepID=Q74MR2_NANEQ|nr:NEQ214 [Nanoarchaeum equitans Kin4-M]